MHEPGCNKNQADDGRRYSPGHAAETQAGWNQTLVEWNRFLALEPDGCFVAELDSRAVGTATTCTFGTVGWIGMMLVDQSSRGRGVGKALMHQALDYLAAKGVTSFRLDATPLGQPLYEKLGFLPQLQITRFDGEVKMSAPRASADVATISASEWKAVVALDAATVGCDRGRLLRKLRADGLAEAIVRVDDRVLGYGLARAGAMATQIGPCIASQPEPGRSVLTSLLSRFLGQRVFVDVPELNEQAAAVVTDAGLTPARQLVRMCRGKPHLEHVDCLWASSGPEKG